MQILFEHPWFLVINKPADLLTQAVDGVASVQKELAAQLKSLAPLGANPFIGVPHRLDRVTTGVMVLARNQRALSRLSEQFASRKVSKKYHGLVALNSSQAESTYNGFVGDQPQKWIDWIRKIPDVAKAELCQESDTDSKQAILYARVIGRGNWIDDKTPLGLLEFELETGRMHQIRIQCESRGLPILGDDVYGSQITWLAGDYWQNPIALHARSIEFHHPQTAERLSFIAPYPESWQRCSFVNRV